MTSIKLNKAGKIYPIIFWSKPEGMNELAIRATFKLEKQHFISDKVYSCE